jgi:hypothetical protein
MSPTRLTRWPLAVLVRTGLLDAGAPMAQTAQIDPAPTWRTIPAIIYNGLPFELRGLIGGPFGDQSENVGIATNGSATKFNLARHYTSPVSGGARDFTLEYGQVIPKPFCSLATGSLPQGGKHGHGPGPRGPCGHDQGEFGWGRELPELGEVREVAAAEIRRAVRAGLAVP